MTDFFERAARQVLGRPDTDDEDDLAPRNWGAGKRPVPPLPRLPWLDRRLRFWDDPDRDFKRACAERKRVSSNPFVLDN